MLSNSTLERKLLFSCQSSWNNHSRPLRSDDEVTPFSFLFFFLFFFFLRSLTVWKSTVPFWTETTRSQSIPTLIEPPIFLCWSAVLPQTVRFRRESVEYPPGKQIYPSVQDITTNSGCNARSLFTRSMRCFMHTPHTVSHGVSCRFIRYFEYTRPRSYRGRQSWHLQMEWN